MATEIPQKYVWQLGLQKKETLPRSQNSRVNFQMKECCRMIWSLHNYKRRLQRLTRAEVNSSTLLMHLSFSLSRWYQLKPHPFIVRRDTSVFVFLYRTSGVLIGIPDPPLYKLKKSNIRFQRGKLIGMQFVWWFSFINFFSILPLRRLSQWRP